MKASEFGSTRGRASTSSAPSSRSVSRWRTRGRAFIAWAFAGESALGVVALALGRLFHVFPLEQLHFSWLSLLWGLVATLPLLLTLRWILTRQDGRWQELIDFVAKQFGPLLVHRSAGELALLAAAAGFAEELLFRGVIQTALARPLPMVLALLVASSLFGLAHIATVNYALFAGLMGLYLGTLFLIQGSLLPPMIAHALYDLLALTIVVRRYRSALET